MASHVKISTNAILPMEGVNIIVLIRLVASNAAVGQATCWMEMD